MSNQWVDRPTRKQPEQLSRKPNPRKLGRTVLAAIGVTAGLAAAYVFDSHPEGANSPSAQFSTGPTAIELGDTTPMSSTYSGLVAEANGPLTQEQMTEAVGYLKAEHSKITPGELFQVPVINPKK